MLVVHIMHAMASQVAEVPLLVQVVAIGMWVTQTIMERPSVSG
jgi:hypothetical protein